MSVNQAKNQLRVTPRATKVKARTLNPSPMSIESHVSDQNDGHSQGGTKKIEN